MKPRLLDAMGEALALVRKSNLAEATAVLREALSGRSASGEKRETDAEPQRPPVPTFTPPARRPLGQVLRALREPSTVPPDGVDAPETGPAYEFGERFTSRTYRGAAGSLNYRLYVPAGYQRRDLALVIMLHGCTQNPDDFALGTRMNDLADEFGLVVAYPHQPRRANPSGCWNWFDKRHQNRGSGEPAKLAGLAQSLASEFRVRKGRVFSAGLSAGGAMAEVLAATYPDVFDAVGIHSGLPYKCAADVPSAYAAMKGTAPVDAGPPPASNQICRRIVIHGGADLNVHPANGERILEQAERGASSLNRTGSDWQTESGRVMHTVLKDRDGLPVVEHWFVEGGGHAWFGGDRRGTYTQTVGVDASRVMVRFFLERPS
jgi:poly(hydroxyalkanoate) depolymerase family esterase